MPRRAGVAHERKAGLDHRRLTGREVGARARWVRRDGGGVGCKSNGERCICGFGSNLHRQGLVPPEVPERVPAQTARRREYEFSSKVSARRREYEFSSEVSARRPRPFGQRANVCRTASALCVMWHVSCVMCHLPHCVCAVLCIVPAAAQRLLVEQIIESGAPVEVRRRRRLRMPRDVGTCHSHIKHGGRGGGCWGCG